MKKIYHFAMAAVVMFAMVACGNNNVKQNGKTEEQPVAEQETSQPAETETVQEEPQLPVGPCTLDFEMFSVDLPEGWKVLKQDRHEAKIYPGTGDEFKGSILVQEQPYRQMAEMVKTYQGLQQTRDLGEVSFGTNKFRGFENEMGDFTVMMKANEKDEFVMAEVRSDAYKNEAYKQILASIKLK